MGKIYLKEFGKITKCICRSDGSACADWRTKYIDKPGMLIVGKSEKKYPGQSFFYFYPFTDDWEQPYIGIPRVDVETMKECCVMTSQDSIYEFIYGDFGLGEMEKKELKLNVMGGK
jgi:hypothetical protein